MRATICCNCYLHHFIGQHVSHRQNIYRKYLIWIFKLWLPCLTILFKFLFNFFCFCCAFHTVPSRQSRCEFEFYDWSRAPNKKRSITGPWHCCECIFVVAHFDDGCAQLKQLVLSDKKNSLSFRCNSFEISSTLQLEMDLK